MIKFIKCPSVNYCDRYDSIGCEKCVTYKAYLIGIDIGMGEIPYAHEKDSRLNEEQVLENWENGYFSNKEEYKDGDD